MGMVPIRRPYFFFSNIFSKKSWLCALRTPISIILLLITLISLSVDSLNEFNNFHEHLHKQYRYINMKNASKFVKISQIGTFKFKFKVKKTRLRGMTHVLWWQRELKLFQISTHPWISYEHDGFHKEIARTCKFRSYLVCPTIGELDTADNISKVTSVTANDQILKELTDKETNRFRLGCLCEEGGGGTFNNCWKGYNLPSTLTILKNIGCPKHKGLPLTPILEISKFQNLGFCT